jgi:hypothetical protein
MKLIIEILSLNLETGMYLLQSRRLNYRVTDVKNTKALIWARILPGCRMIPIIGQRKSRR